MAPAHAARPGFVESACFESDEVIAPLGEAERNTEVFRLFAAAVRVATRLGRSGERGPVKV